jgi:uncharacterized repeat protein (TIGR03943 family)
VNSRTQSFILLLLGGALLRLGAGDLLLRYVRPVARTWVLLAGAGLVVAAIAQLILAHRASADREPATRAGWLMMAPVVAIVIIAPPALGAFSADRALVGVDTRMHKEFPPLAGPSPHRLPVIDFTTRVLWDSGRTVQSEDVQLTGFVLRQRPDGFVLARLVITCCAADARPVEVIVRTTDRPSLSSWQTVVGRYAGRDPVLPTFPVLAATSVTPVRPPTNPYE